MSKFKDRYVLAEGYPWAIGTGPYTEIVMHTEPYITGECFDIDFPIELWKNELPKYRLVLEKVTERQLDTESEE